MISYQHVPPPGAPDYREVCIVREGFPARWVETYVRRRLFEFDPIKELALSRSDPYLWSEVGQLMSLTPDQVNYLEELKRAQLGDGLALPVFGPNGRNGYVGLGFKDNKKTESDSLLQLREFQWLCQSTHLKYCQLILPKLSAPTQLSRREQEVLQWIARGKSNMDISSIMALSPNTVDTYLRRIFSKLDAADRVTAAVKGVGSGLISI